jgi:hypothetical protein
MMSDREEDAVNGWIDLEMARQRREELLREAREWRRRRPPARRIAEARGVRPAPIRRLLRFLRPEADDGIAAPKQPVTPVRGCSAD